MDLFAIRSIGLVADIVKQSKNAFYTKDSAFVRNAMAVLGDLEDISNATLNKLTMALKGDTLTAQEVFLQSFWDCHAVDIYPTESRLFVNPPTGLCDHSSYSHTYRTTGMCGAYGSVVTNRADLSIMRSPGDANGYFNDVAMFLDRNADIDAILNHIIPGSTLSLFSPGVAHGVWMSLLGMNPFLDTFMQKASERFNLVEISLKSTESVNLGLFGVETK